MFRWFFRMSQAVARRVRQYVVNRLFDWRQFVLELNHPGVSASTRADIKDLVQGN
jgi:ribosomal protein S24E